MALLSIVARQINPKPSSLKNSYFIIIFSHGSGDKFPGSYCRRKSWQIKHGYYFEKKTHKMLTVFTIFSSMKQ